MIRPRHIKKFDGCDTVIQLGDKRDKIRVLQITETPASGTTECASCLGLRPHSMIITWPFLEGPSSPLRGMILLRSMFPLLLNTLLFPVICESSEIFLLTKNKIIIKIKRRYELFVAPFLLLYFSRSRGRALQPSFPREPTW